MKNHLFFASCSKGLEDILVAELTGLGITEIKTGNGGVHFEGEMRQAYLACLWSRVASRILLKLSDFSVNSEDDLYAAIKMIDWSAHMTVTDDFAIDCFSSHPAIKNSHYATLRIKDAIVDQFKETCGSRPDVSREHPSIRINVYLSERECIAYLDLSGEPLHMRAYRQSAGTAPLRETLAAAMLYRAKWQDFADNKQPLFDPMCGSGTLLIEGAMIAANMAPGLLRDYYGFLGWKQFDADLWSLLHQQAEQGLAQRIKDLPVIVGCDYVKQVLDIAEKNIAAAGFSAQIKLELADTSKTIPFLPAGQGLVISNPPYGKRLGQIQQLRTLYLRLGKNLKQFFPGWTAAIFTAEDELAKSIGLRAFHKNTLFNGAIKCTLYQYHINDNHRDDKAVSGSNLDSRQAETRLFSPHKEVNEYVQMFVNRLKKNNKHLTKWARKNHISCYRIYDADIPQYAVAIDRYEGWIHVQEYAAPKTVNQSKAFRRLTDVLDVIAQTLDVEADRIVLKVRKKQSGKSQYQQLDNKHKRLIVHESGLKFIINLYDYLDTGLFADHRKTRQLIYRLAAGSKFLNLFAYTGSATVYAAAGGATSTTTVDMSNTYLQWAEENLRLNGFNGRKQSVINHAFIRADCTQWLWEAKRAGKLYDLIFLDPPTFSNSTKMQNSFDIQRDHGELISLTMHLLQPQGCLIFSTNARKFKLAKALQQQYAVREITSITMTEDFRRKPLHRSWGIAFDDEILQVKLRG